MQNGQRFVFQCNNSTNIKHEKQQRQQHLWNRMQQEKVARTQTTLTTTKSNRERHENPLKRGPVFDVFSWNFEVVF